MLGDVTSMTRPSRTSGTGSASCSRSSAIAAWSGTTRSTASSWSTTPNSDRFGKLRVSIEQVDRLQQEMTLAKPECLADSGEIGDVFFDEEGVHVVTEFSSSSQGWCPRRGGYVSLIASADMQRRCLAWLDIRTRLTKLLAQTRHASITVQTGARWQHIQGGTSPSTWKRTIRWWTVPELKHILHCRGPSGTTAPPLLPPGAADAAARAADDPARADPPYRTPG